MSIFKHQSFNKYAEIILIYQNQHFNANKLDLEHKKAIYNHHSDHIKIDASIAIVLHNLNQPHILPLFFS